MPKIFGSVLAVATLSWIGGMMFQQSFGGGNHMMVMMIHQEDRPIFVGSSSRSIVDDDFDEYRYDDDWQRRCHLPPTSDTQLPPDDVKSMIRYLQTVASTKYINRTGEELSLVNGGIGFGGVLEMEDPMGGRHHRCLQKYFPRGSRGS
jgi:hypothetical protein